MKNKTASQYARQFALVSLMSGVIAAFGFVFMGPTAPAAEAPNDDSESGAAVEPSAAVAADGDTDVAGWAWIDATRVEGHRLCFDCHRSEISAWMKSKHGGASFDKLRTVSAQTHVEKLNENEAADKIALDQIATQSFCVNCHGTPQQDSAGRHRPIAAVSCEACHNPAGGADGWLNPHAVYGPKGTRREDETREHFQARAARCRSAGQIRSADLYLMAKRCLQCHSDTHERLVNETGHRTRKKPFELASWSMGEVRHNFHLDQQHNAEAATLWTHAIGQPAGQRTATDRLRLMYVVGQLADLEVALHDRAHATTTGNFAKGAATRIKAAKANLEKIAETVDIAEVGAALEALEPISTRMLLLTKLDDNATFGQAAAGVEKAAMDFASRHDGSKLEGIENLVPAPMGEVYQPTR